MTLTRLSSSSGTLSSSQTERHFLSRCSTFTKHNLVSNWVPTPHQKRCTNLLVNSATSWQDLPRMDSCEVDLDYGSSGQEQVTATILIKAPVKTVWEVLTDFSSLVDVVPNLIACEEVRRPNPQTRRIRQSAGLKCNWWRIQAEALLDVQSFTLPNGDKELRFEMIEGDFKEYQGRFLIQAETAFTSKLIFDAVIEPLESIPEMLFVHAVQIWLPFNLNGIVREAEKITQKQASVSPFTAASIEADVSLGSNSTSQTLSSAVWYAKALEDAKARRRVKRRTKATPADYLGTAFVPLPASAPEFRNVPCIRWETIPSFELDEAQMTGVEVHLRKLDSLDFLHRRVVCCVRINAPSRAVWSVLTDYERLTDFVPNLVTSEVLPCPMDAPEGYKRIRQVVRKQQSYVQLQAESVLDVVELPFKEIQFRQVSGFVQRLQGKWMLKSVTNEWNEEDTLLTYALELKTAHSDIPLELIEPVFEQAAVEGLPLNLSAVKQEVMKSQGRPPLSKLSQNFESLRTELVLSYGTQGIYLPTRYELRKDHRTDLEKAISAHGGSAAVSERMGWKLKNKRRKRRGYWDDFRNVEQEIMEFKMEYGLMEDQLPSKNTLNQAGRVDLRRAVEKWGGIHAVMELIELEQSTTEQLNKPELRSKKLKIDIHDLDDLE